MSYGADTGVSLALSELFADFDVDNRVFVRAGKQTVNWGVGTFFSPANLINLDEIDPEDPHCRTLRTGQRQGATAYRYRQSYRLPDSR